MEPQLVQLSRLLLTIGVGYSGAWGASRLRLPGSLLIGPMLAVGALQVLGAPLLVMDAGYRNAAQILIGATVASTLTPAIVARLPSLLGPAATGVFFLIVLSIVGGAVVHLTIGLNPATALFAGAPGGAGEMALAAGDLGGDVELVAALHLARQILVVSLLPPLLRWVLRNRPG